MKFLTFLQNTATSLKSGVKRFAGVFGLSFAFFAVFAFYTITENDSSSLCAKLYLSLFFGIIFSFAATIFAEKHKSFKNPQLLGILSGILSFVICFIPVHIFYDFNTYITMVYIGICLALLCLCAKILVYGENKNEILPYILRRIFFTGGIGIVLSIGISVCIAAFNALVFDFDDVDKVYLILNAFIWIVVIFNLFISSIPDESTVYGEAKFYKVFVLYAAFPVYMLLLAILYIYFIKILVTSKLPSGEINWFSSFSLLFFVFFVFCLRQYKTKITNLFVRFGGLLMLPVSAMQFVALFIRINTYGFTVSRIASLILATIALAFAVGFTFFRKRPENVFIFSAVLILSVTVLPKINLVDVSIASQTKRIEQTLIKNNMLENGKITPHNDLSGEDKQTINSAFRYVNGFDIKFTGVLKGLDDKSFENIFGFESRYYYYIEENTHCYYVNENKTLNVSEYSYMTEIDRYNSQIVFTAGGVEYSFDGDDIFNHYYQLYGNEYFGEIEPYMLTENICLYPKTMNFSVDDTGSYMPQEYSSIRGYVLTK